MVRGVIVSWNYWGWSSVWYIIQRSKTVGWWRGRVGDAAAECCGKEGSPRKQLCRHRYATYPYDNPQIHRDHRRKNTLAIRKYALYRNFNGNVWKTGHLMLNSPNKNQMQIKLCSQKIISPILYFHVASTSPRFIWKFIYIPRTIFVYPL